ncbi:MAG: MarR family winged helix-turn-helix transcriptional regulator [Sphingomonas sp.]
MRIIVSRSDESDVALVARAVLRLARRMRVEAPPGKLSAGAVGLLAALHREGPLTGVQLATAEGLKPQSLTRLLAKLEGEGLIARVADAADRRNLVITLLPAGRRVLRDAMDERRRWLAGAIDERLDPAERNILLEAAALMLRLAL